MFDSTQRGFTGHGAFVLATTDTRAVEVMGISQSAVRKPYQREHLPDPSIDQQWEDLPDLIETTVHHPLHALSPEYEPGTLRLPPSQAQLEAFYDAILRPHLDRIEELAKHVGQLTVERDAAITERIKAEQRLASDRALLDLAAAEMDRSMASLAAD